MISILDVAVDGVIVADIPVRSTKEVEVVVNGSFLKVLTTFDPIPGLAAASRASAIASARSSDAWG
jgi:tryptophan synthase alpha subunit